MAIYNKHPEDVAAELPALFPDGFTVGTLPTAEQVAGWLTIADAMVALKVHDATGQPASATDAAAPLAGQAVIEWAKCKVLDVVYAGIDPVARSALGVGAGVGCQNYKDLIDAITSLGSQAAGGEPQPGVVYPASGGASYGTGTRALIVSDEELDGCAARRSRKW